NNQDDELDAGDLIKLLAKFGDWPNTSISTSVFTQDRDGRPRWAIRLDWPVEQLVERVQTILSDEAAKALLEDVTLRKESSGHWRLDLPDTALAVLMSTHGGSLIVSSRDVRPPATLFGQKSGEGKQERSLVYCRLNLDADEEDAKEKSAFAGFSAVSDVRYA